MVLVDGPKPCRGLTDCPLCSWGKGERATCVGIGRWGSKVFSRGKEDGQMGGERTIELAAREYKNVE